MQPIGIYIFLAVIAILYLISKISFKIAENLYRKYYKSHPHLDTWFFIGENSEKLTKFTIYALAISIICNIIRLMMVVNHQINHVG